MNGERLVRIAMDNSPMARRGMGKPRKRWSDLTNIRQRRRRNKQHAYKKRKQRKICRVKLIVALHGWQVTLSISKISFLIQK